MKLQLPAQDVLDAWVKEHSKGIMESFPEVGADVYAVLASILAADISWTAPYDVIKAPESMSFWDVEKVLAKGESGGNVRGFLTRVVRDPKSGLLLGVHWAVSDTGGMDVTSMVGDAPVEELLTLNERYTQNPGSFEVVEAAQLHEIDTPSWLTVEKRRSIHRDDVYEVLLPAWQASATHKISEQKSLSILVRALLEGSLGAEANGSGVSLAQAVEASYGATGFKAAALTTMMIGRAAMPALWDGYRVRICFDRPYAVVADDSSHIAVFSGVVREAVSA